MATVLPRSASLRVVVSDVPTLADGLRRRDPEALRQFFNTRYSLVRRIVWRILGPDHEAEDVAQQAMIAAVESVHKFRGDNGSLDPWLTTITVFTVRRLLRKRMTLRLFRVFRDVDEADAILERLPIEERSILRTLYALLDGLPTRERLTWSLRFIEGLSLQAVADSCGLSLATTKRALVKARERLRAGAAAHPDLLQLIDEARSDDDG